MPERSVPFSSLRRLLAAVVASLLLLVAPAGARAQAPVAPDALAELAAPTSLAAHDGWVLFSRWDGTAYRLAVVDPDGRMRDLDVPPQEAPFRADAGPDASGRPSGVFSACPSGGDCDLYVISLEEGAQPRPVRNANTRGRDEVAPSIDRGRLVFGRRYPVAGEIRSKVVVYTKRLSAPRSRPSTRLPDLPRRRCVRGRGEDRCTMRTLQAPGLVRTDLGGGRVAQTWTYVMRGAGGLRQSEVRLTTTGGRDVRQVAHLTADLGGQAYVGASLVGGHLRFAYVCEGAPDGCAGDDAGVVDYDIARPERTRIRRAGSQAIWSEWTTDGEREYSVDASGEQCRLDVLFLDGGSCQLSARPLTRDGFARIAPARLR